VDAVDADATRVDLNIEANDLAMRATTVRDNGHGIPHDEVKTLFGRLGGAMEGSYSNLAFFAGRNARVDLRP
jgi:hypothetical protein